MALSTVAIGRGRGYPRSHRGTEKTIQGSERPTGGGSVLCDFREISAIGLVFLWLAEQGDESDC